MSPSSVAMRRCLVERNTRGASTRVSTASTAQDSGPHTHPGYIVAVAATIRRQALDSVGVDGRLRSVEDLDLWIRLITAGWRAFFSPRCSSTTGDAATRSPPTPEACCTPPWLSTGRPPRRSAAVQSRPSPKPRRGVAHSGSIGSKAKTCCRAGLVPDALVF